MIGTSVHQIATKIRKLLLSDITGFTPPKITCDSVYGGRGEGGGGGKEWDVQQAIQLHTEFRNTFKTHNSSTLPRCYTPPFCKLLSGKRGGGGVTTRTCAFTSQLSPPPPPPLPRICVLCSAVEGENSFDRHAVAALKDGRVVGHVQHMLPFFDKTYIAGSLAARLLPPAATAG